MVVLDNLDKNPNIQKFLEKFHGMLTTTFPVGIIKMIKVATQRFVYTIHNNFLYNYSMWSGLQYFLKMFSF